MAPYFTASIAPKARWSTALPYAVNADIYFGSIGLLKKTIFPSIFFFPKLSKSLRLKTSITLAFRPTEGVATDPPRAAIGTLNVIPGSVSIKANSFGPLTHLGTITGWSHTLSKPNLSNSDFDHSMALWASKDPESLPPIWLDK